MSAIPLEVKEWMKGYLGAGASDYDAGFIKGIDADAFFVHELLFKIDDIDRFVSDPAHACRVEGYLSFAAFGGKRQVEAGATVNLFVDTQNPKLKHMKYRLPFTTDKKQALTLYGHKTIHDDKSLDAWSDATTLYTSIHEGHPTAAQPPSAPAPLAMGIIHIEKLDLFRSLLSFRSPGSSISDAHHALTAFGTFFLGNLWDTYGRVARVSS